MRAHMQTVFLVYMHARVRTKSVKDSWCGLYASPMWAPMHRFMQLQSPPPDPMRRQPAGLPLPAVALECVLTRFLLPS